MSPIDGKRARRLARIGGALYLLIIILGTGGAVLRDNVVVAGSPSATAAKLRSLEMFWRAGVAAEVVLLTATVALAVILYVLLRRISVDLARTAVLFNLICVAVEAVAAVSLASALTPLGRTYSGAFTPEQSSALAMLAIRSHNNGFSIALIFFGVECLILGWLIFRTPYLPKALGPLMQLAGACYLVSSFAFLLWPALANQLFPAILMPALVGELSLALWLLAKGINVQRWDSFPSPAR